MPDLLDLAAWLYEIYEKSTDSGASSECGISSENQKSLRNQILALDPENVSMELTDRIKTCVTGSAYQRKATYWLLRELNEAHGTAYQYLFRQRAYRQSGDRCLLTVGSGDLVPILQLNLKTIGLDHPSTRSKEIGIRRLPALPFKVELNFEWSDQLAALFRQRMKVMAAVLNREAGKDFRIRSDGAYFWVELVAAKTQLEKLQRCLELASSQQVDLLVLPELSLPPEAAELIAQYTGIHDWPRIVVGGLMHEASSRGFINHCVSWACDRRMVQFKRGAFHDSQSQLTEWLADTGEQPVRVLMSERSWTFSTAICCDFLEHNTHVLTALAECGVNLAAVPAWSRKTDLFGQRSQTLKSRNQSVTVVSNGCPVGTKGYVCHAARFDAPIDGFSGSAYEWPAGKDAPQLFDFTLAMDP